MMGWQKRILVVAFLASALLLVACSDKPQVAGPTDTPEPIVPTRTRLPELTPEPAMAESTLEPTLPIPPPSPTSTPPRVSLSPKELARFGVAGPLEHARLAA